MLSIIIINKYSIQLERNESHERGWGSYLKNYYIIVEG